MASSLIQQKKGANTSTTTLVISTTSNTLTGDTLVVAIIGNTGTDQISSVTATGMTFVKNTSASGLIGGGAASYISIWVAENVTGATTPSISIVKSATWAIQALVNHYRGLTTASVDKVARAGGTTTSASSGNTATLSQADELVVGIVGSDYGGAVYTAGSGYGNLNQQSAAAGDIAIEDKVVAAATTAVSATMTLDNTTDQAAAVITFKIASTDTLVDITKTAQYAVLSTPADITKASQYYIPVTSADATITATYMASNSPSAITVSASYAIEIITTITKSATYVIPSSADVTKASQYVVPSQHTISILSGYEVSAVPLQKRYVYKVYDPTGTTFINSWTNEVISDLTISEQINMTGTEVIVTLARTADSFGEGEDIDFKNMVKIYVIDKEQPNGMLRFTGFISNYESDYSSETVNVTLLSYGADMNLHVMEDATGNTTIAFNSYDPSNALRSILDYFNADGGVVSYIGAKSLSTTGVDSSNAVTSAHTLGLTDANIFSCSFWIYPKDVSSNRQTIYGCDNTASVFQIEINSTSGFVTAIINGTVIANVTTSVLTADTWNHIVYTRNGTGANPNKIYVDKVSKTLGTDASTAYTDSSSVRRLGNRTSTTQKYNGYIDEFEIWDKALTLGEVQALYDTNTKPSGTPKIRYTFDETQVGTVYNTGSVSGADATLANSTITYYSPAIVKSTTAHSIDDTTTSTSYTFNTNTAKEGIDKCLELAPEGWYYYIDIAANILYFKLLSETPDHTFSIGRDIIDIHIKKNLEPVVNTVYFSGGDVGGGVILYKKYTIPASIAAYGIRGLRLKDGRVTLAATASILSTSALRGDPEILVTLSVVDSNLNNYGYDIDSIHIAQTVKIGSSGIGASSQYDVGTYDTSPYDYDISNLSSIVFQITSFTYYGNEIRFTLATTPPDITKRIKDISRNLVDLQNNDNPTIPS